MAGPMRVAVIGSQTCHADTPLAYTVYRTSVNYQGLCYMAYTVYRTSVNYQGLCYHRLIRFRHFAHFGKNLRLAAGASRISVKLPPKIWWSRKASLQPETVEARQVLLNEYMQQVCTRPLTPKSHERLEKLLQVGDYAPKEEEDRVINSRLSFRERNTETASEIVDRNHSIQTETVEEVEAESEHSVEKEKQQQDSLTDEEEPTEYAENLSVHRQDSQASSNPAADEYESQSDRPLLAPVLQVTTRPVSMSLNSQHMKRVILGSDADLLALKEGGRDSTDSSDFSSTPERHYFGQIKEAIASIEEIMDSSRKHAGRIRDLHTSSRPMK
ncbi:hypothetical protein PHMEG_0005095 [Phytophthora megakarya]|uniref:PX domain-containing protein n=1 Tax=Phytophthora megakarya TaxID=4795 RepID=A0A225WU95_9STRA|nr:hypothetical protein PHMEG_0005095 [Phytophthora megakarya]